MTMSIFLNGYVRLILSIVVAIVLLWILLRFREKKNPQKSSLDFLKERMENGDITEAEYEEAKRRQKSPVGNRK